MASSQVSSSKEGTDSVAQEISSRCKPSYLFFDLDGTLADSLPGIQFSIQAAFFACRRQLPIEDLRPYIGPDMRTILKRIDSQIKDEDLDVMEAAYRSSYDMGGCQKTILYPGVQETLDALSRDRIPMYLVTNKPSLATANILKKFEIISYFRESVSRDSRHPSYASKTEMMQDILLRCDLDPLLGCMVGDTAEDWNAASESRIPFIHAAYGYGRLPENAAEAIQEFSQLLARFHIDKAKSGNLQS